MAARRRGKGYAISLKCRKRIEEAFGWLKTVGLAQDPPQRLGQGVRAGDVVLRGLSFDTVAEPVDLCPGGGAGRARLRPGAPGIRPKADCGNGKTP